MSHSLINRSTDLKKLVEDGYRIEIRSGFLIAHDIPYVNGLGKVQMGKLISELQLAGEKTTQMKTHVAYFAGEYPCDKHGRPLKKIKHRSNKRQLDPTLIADHSFSSKPPEGRYRDYHHQIQTYANIISAPAEAIDSTVTARPRKVVPAAASESVFKYTDTASSRAGTAHLNQCFEKQTVGIIGLGKTGSYVLDLIAKCPVKKIHVYDADDFLQHNAFRSPGAPTLKTLEKRPKKVHHFRRLYSRIRRGIHAHPVNIDAKTANFLDELTFAFICIDDSCAKKRIVEELEHRNIAFIDVGMGVNLQDNQLRGVIRTTFSTPDYREHVHSKGRIPFSEIPIDEAYSQNIQIADLNALNAALAVIRWKRHLGYYADLDQEHFSTYTIDGNAIANDDRRTK